MRDALRRDQVRTMDWSLSQVYALVLGIGLVLIGVAGFAADASFEAGADIDGGLLAGFEVNGWHNLVHIVSGLLGIAVFRSTSASRAFALGFGAVYGVVAVWGFLAGDQVLWLLPVNLADNVLHVGIALLGLIAGLVDLEREDAVRHPAR